MSGELHDTSSEYETCDVCGCVHSKYDEHEPNNCVDVLKAENARLRLALGVLLREGIAPQTPADTLAKALQDEKDRANAHLARLLTVERAAAEVASYGTKTEDWRLETWTNWEADSSRLRDALAGRVVTRAPGKDETP